MGNDPQTALAPGAGQINTTSPALANRESTMLERIHSHQDGINQTLHSNCHRLSDLLVRLRGPVPEQVPETGEDFPNGQLGALEGITNANIRKAEEMRQLITELETLV